MGKDTPADNTRSQVTTILIITPATIYIDTTTPIENETYNGGVLRKGLIISYVDSIIGSRSFWSRLFGSGTFRSRSFWSWSFGFDLKDII